MMPGGVDYGLEKNRAHGMRPPGGVLPGGEYVADQSGGFDDNFIGYCVCCCKACCYFYH